MCMWNGRARIEIHVGCVDAHKAPLDAIFSQFRLCIKFIFIFIGIHEHMRLTHTPTGTRARTRQSERPRVNFCQTKHGNFVYRPSVERDYARRRRSHSVVRLLKASALSPHRFAGTERAESKQQHIAPSNPESVSRSARGSTTLFAVWKVCWRLAPAEHRVALSANAPMPRVHTASWRRRARAAREGDRASARERKEVLGRSRRGESGEVGHEKSKRRRKRRSGEGEEGGGKKSKERIGTYDKAWRARPQERAGRKKKRKGTKRRMLCHARHRCAARFSRSEFKMFIHFSSFMKIFFRCSSRPPEYVLNKKKKLMRENEHRFAAFLFSFFVCFHFRLTSLSSSPSVNILCAHLIPFSFCRAAARSPAHGESLLVLFSRRIAFPDSNEMWKWSEDNKSRRIAD